MSKKPNPKDDDEPKAKGKTKEPEPEQPPQQPDTHPVAGGPNPSIEDQGIGPRDPYPTKED